MSLQLPRLPQLPPTHAELQVWWQQVVEAIEAQETTQDELIAALEVVVSDLSDAVAAILAAQAAADAAQAAADQAAADAAAAAAAAAAAQAEAESRQEASPVLDEFADLAGDGLVRRNPDGTFEPLPIGAAAPTDILDRASADARYTAAGVTQYTDEMAQDAVGGILTDSAEIDFTYDDGAGTIAATLKAGSIDEAKLDASVNASLDLADSVAGAWTAFTPAAPTSGSGAFGTVSAAGRYKQIDKTVFIWIAVTITANGTAGSYFDVTAPVASRNVASSARQPLACGDAITDNILGSCTILNNSTTIRVTKYDGTYLGGTGRVIVIAGSYEAA